MCRNLLGSQLEVSIRHSPVRPSALIAVFFHSHTATRDDQSNHTQLLLQLCDSAAESPAGKSCTSQLAVGNTPTVLQGPRHGEKRKPTAFSQKQSGLSGQGRVLTQPELHHPSALVKQQTYKLCTSNRALKQHICFPMPW